MRHSPRQSIVDVVTELAFDLFECLSSLPTVVAPRLGILQRRLDECSRALAVGSTVLLYILIRLQSLARPDEEATRDIGSIGLIGDLRCELEAFESIAEREIGRS
jgi:hypothetical protein